MMDIEKKKRLFIEETIDNSGLIVKFRDNCKDDCQWLILWLFYMRMY
jgi:hypothetical protein